MKGLRTSDIRDIFVIPAEKRNVGTNERLVSIVAGILLSIYASRRRTAFPLLVPAGYLIYRGATGYCLVNQFTGRNTTGRVRPFTFKKTIKISRDRSDVYYYWRNLENLPTIMKHISKVQKLSDKQYHWEVMFSDKRFTWDAVITEEIPDHKISWQSLESADISNSGTVEFMDVPGNTGNSGTLVKVTINYVPSETESGRVVAGFLNPIFKKVVKEDLKDFKRKLESGEIPVTKPFVSS